MREKEKRREKPLLCVSVRVSGNNGGWINIGDRMLRKGVKIVIERVSNKRGSYHIYIYIYIYMSTHSSAIKKGLFNFILG